MPSGVIAFKVAADPNNPNLFYAATGAGLFRSTDGGATFANVELPTGECTGKAPTGRCALANMVTGVVVEGPANASSAGGTPGAVVAAVGWRAADKKSAHGDYPESPGNGVYVSSTGAKGTFTKGGGFTPTVRPGRIELGAATAPSRITATSTPSSRTRRSSTAAHRAAIPDSTATSRTRRTSAAST